MKIVSYILSYKINLVKGDNMNRTILHCDFNNFFASVECMLNPQLKDKFVAVCGNPDERKGIILAKNEKAKKMGVKTGETIIDAMLKCPGLVLVPPHFDKYYEYSLKAAEIYFKYTDLIEPFGMDECWLDVTGSIRLLGDGITIAKKIKKEIKKELGLTISVGVSFNKVFSKLGSDLKKPDGLFEIKRENFKKITYNIPIASLIGVGRSTEKLLLRYGIKTIGQMASISPEFMERILGKRGIMLWKYVNGYENSKVCEYGKMPRAKSVGHGTTVRKNLENNDEVWRVIYELSQQVGERLRKIDTYALGVELEVKDCELKKRNFSCKLLYPTKNSRRIAEMVFSLFLSNYKWENPIRALSVRATELITEISDVQLDFSVDLKKEDKISRIDKTVDIIHNIYGQKAITYGSLMGEWQPSMPSVLPVSGAVL